MKYPPITARQLALARFSIDLMQMRPERAEAFIGEMGVAEHTAAAIRRGLQDPVKFREWAEGVVAQWRKEQQ